MSAAHDHRPVIRIAAGLIVDEADRALLVRKRATQMFMQAGGKIESGETPLAALTRELEEELGLIVKSGEAEYLGRFVAAAAHEDNHLVEAEVFYIARSDAVSPAAEIEEIAWVDPSDSVNLPLAPLTRDQLLPIVLNRAAQGLKANAPPT